MQKAVNELNARVPIVCQMQDPSSTDVDVADVSHSVIGVNCTRNGLYASIQILDTPSGQILKSLIESLPESSHLSIGQFATLGKVDEGNRICDIQFINVGIDSGEDVEDPILNDR